MDEHQSCIIQETSRNYPNQVSFWSGCWNLQIQQLLFRPNISRPQILGHGWQAVAYLTPFMEEERRAQASWIFKSCWVRFKHVQTIRGRSSNNLNLAKYQDPIVVRGFPTIDPHISPQSRFLHPGHCRWWRSQPAQVQRRCADGPEPSRDFGWLPMGIKLHPDRYIYIIICI